MTEVSEQVETLQWFKSSYSGGNQTECVEVAGMAAGTAVRDSTAPDGARLRFCREAWSVFVHAVAESPTR